VWKGVLLRDVLIKCGIKRPTDGANHVCFVGAEKLPKGKCGALTNYLNEPLLGSQTKVRLYIPPSDFINNT